MQNLAVPHGVQPPLQGPSGDHARIFIANKMLPSAALRKQLK